MTYIHNQPQRLPRCRDERWPGRRRILREIGPEPRPNGRLRAAISPAVARTDAFEKFAADETLKELISAIERDTQADRPAAALDRLHTYCMKKTAHPIERHGGTWNRDEPLHSRMGKYVRLLETERQLREISKRTLKSGISIFDSFNDVRNNESLAHDNDLVNHAEARNIRLDHCSVAIHQGHRSGEVRQVARVSQPAISVLVHWSRRDGRTQFDRLSESGWLKPTDEGLEGEMGNRIAQKWGFGMAPPKPRIVSIRRKACETVLSLLDAGRLPTVSDDVLEAMSTVKGLFNRVVREDQWDWFTVAGHLGYPSRRIAQVIVDESSRLRTAIKSGDVEMFDRARTNLLRLPTRRCLAVQLGHATIANEIGAGWLYVLSTRELPKLLKVGMTTRSVEERAREINSATGVAIPFGVRRCWRVSDPSKAERLAHHALQKFRVRNDREFFQASFHDAAHLLDNVVRENQLEIRTLDALAGLKHNR